MSLKVGNNTIVSCHYERKSRQQFPTCATNTLRIKALRWAVLQEDREIKRQKEKNKPGGTKAGHASEIILLLWRLLSAKLRGFIVACSQSLLGTQALNVVFKDSNCRAILQCCSKARKRKVLHGSDGASTNTSNQLSETNQLPLTPKSTRYSGELFGVSTKTRFHPSAPSSKRRPVPSTRAPSLGLKIPVTVLSSRSFSVLSLSLPFSRLY